MGHQFRTLAMFLLEMSSKVVTASTGSTGLQKGVQEHMELEEWSTGHGLLLRFDEVADENMSRAPSPLGLPQHETCPG